MKGAGVALIHDYRPDRADYQGYGAVEESFVGPMLPHFTVPVIRSSAPVDGWLNVRWYTWPAPQEHVFISHGIADKNYRTPAKLYGFEHVHSSGPWWTDYYRRLGPEGFSARVFETGYTKLDPLFDGTIPRIERGGRDRLRVLWAPTHSGINGHSRNYPSSFLELRTEIERLLPPDEFEITIAPHPRLREAQGLPIKVTLEEYAVCDVLVADAGSTLYEGWALGLPVVLPDWIVRDKALHRSDRSLETTIYSEQIAHHAHSAGELARAVRRAHAEGISDRALDLIEAVLPSKYLGTSGRRTAEALSEFARGDVKPLSPTSFMWIQSEDGEKFEHVPRKQFDSIYQYKGWVEVAATPIH